MNTYLIIGIIVAILVILGIIFTVIAITSSSSSTTPTTPTSETTTPTTPTSETTTPTTPTTPEPEPEIIENTDITGFNMSGMPLKNMASLEECYQVCQNTNDCHWVNYIKTNKNCYLKTAKKKAPYITKSEGLLLKDYDITGFNMAGTPIENVASVDECYQKCQERTDPKCHWVNYNPNNKNCYLKTANPNPDITTQFKRNT